MITANFQLIRRPAMTHSLTSIEIAVLTGIANGLQSKELAIALTRSKPTVESHIRTLFAKFNARSRAHLVALAMARGVLDPKQVDLAA